MTNRKRTNFRSAPIRGDFIGVDRENETIMGAVVIQAGQLNDDRPWHIDAETLEQVVEFGNKRNKGLKARFTHPNMSDDGMGKMLGKWTNFRIDGDVVRADLKISPRADESPVGEIGSYVLGLAEDEPEYFGVSIVSELDDSMYEDDSELYDEETGTTAFRLSALYAADVVDEPAATRGGLFDSNGLPDLPAMVTKVLDTHFPEATPQELLSRFEGFLQRYFDDSSLSFNVASKEQSMSDNVNVNTDDVQLSQEVVETATEAPELSEVVVEPSVDVVEESPAFDRDFGQKMLERFGAEGLELAFKGLNEVQIVEHFSDAKDAEIESLKQEIEALKSFKGEEALSGAPTDAPEKSEAQKIAEEAERNGSIAPQFEAIIKTTNKVNN